MVLEPLPDEGSSGLAIAPDHSQLLLSPNLDNLPNLAPQENPLRQLLAEERECQLWVGRAAAGAAPTLVLFISPFSCATQNGSSK